MKYTEIFLADLEREVPNSRRVLERFPDGKFDWLVILRDLSKPQSLPRVGSAWLVNRSKS